MLAIGIDYGTTTSWIAMMSEGEGTEMRVNLESESSSLFIDTNNDLFFGHEAYIRRNNPGYYIDRPKNFVVNFNIDGFRRNYGIDFGDVINEFVSVLLAKLGEYDYNEDELVNVTITIPNCYDGSQMKYMYEIFSRTLSNYFKKFELFLLPEPIAAALCYVVDSPVIGSSDSKYIVVCDIGGGTTDVALIHLNRTQCSPSKYAIGFNVIATENDGNLGGSYIDEKLLKYMLPNEIPNLIDKFETTRKLEGCKIRLSTTSYENATIEFNDNTSCNKCVWRDDIETVIDGNIDEINSFRLRLEAKIRSLVSRVSLEYERKYGIEFNWRNVFLLPVGGSMRIPYLQKIFKESFPYSQIINLETESRQTYDSVVYGAMYHSAIMGKMRSNIDKISINGRTCHPIAVEYINRKLYPIVYANMPDGQYEVDILRPLSLKDDGTFNIDDIRFYLSSHTEVAEGELPYLKINIDKTFNANGRKADEIPIVLLIEILNSVIKSIKVTIYNIDEFGNDYVEVFNNEEYR